APSISGLGARSEPMASTAITVGMERCEASDASQLQQALPSVLSERAFCPASDLLSRATGLSAALLSLKLAGFLDFQDLAPLIVPASGAGAMGQFLLVAVGALGKGARRQMVVGAPD